MHPNILLKINEQNVLIKSFGEQRNCLKIHQILMESSILKIHFKKLFDKIQTLTHFRPLTPGTPHQ